MDELSAWDWSPPTRWQRFKIRVGVIREHFAKWLFERVSGHEFPDDYWP